CDEIDEKSLQAIYLKNNAFPNFDTPIKGVCSCIIEAPPTNTIHIYSLTAEEVKRTNNFAIAENGMTKYSAWISNMSKLVEFQNGTLLYESEEPIVFITLEHKEQSSQYKYYITAQAKQDDQQLKLTCGNAGEVWKKYENKINPT
ncbi:unnamed protein product, partial [Owenia fusiformis]